MLASRSASENQRPECRTVVAVRGVQKSAKECSPTPGTRAWSCVGLLSPDRVEAMPRCAGSTIHIKESSTWVPDRRGSTPSAAQCRKVRLDAVRASVTQSIASLPQPYCTGACPRMLAQRSVAWEQQGARGRRGRARSARSAAGVQKECKECSRSAAGVHATRCARAWACVGQSSPESIQAIAGRSGYTMHIIHM